MVHKEHVVEKNSVPASNSATKEEKNQAHDSDDHEITKSVYGRTRKVTVLAELTAELSTPER